jgi:hypothetical protein
VYHFSRPTFAKLSPQLFPLSDRLRTVLAVKNSHRHAQQRRALDSSGPFCSKPSYQEGKGDYGTGTPVASILVPLFRRHRQFQVGSNLDLLPLARPLNPGSPAPVSLPLPPLTSHN